ncbi:MAG: hypothetical protein WCI04_03975 [archaeon]
MVKKKNVFENVFVPTDLRVSSVESNYLNAFSGSVLFFVKKLASVKSIVLKKPHLFLGIIAVASFALVLFANALFLFFAIPTILLFAQQSFSSAKFIRVKKDFDANGIF